MTEADVEVLKHKLAVYEFAGHRQFDAFVTECPALLRYRKLKLARWGPTVVTPDEALALIGLHRRLSDDYSFILDSGTFKFGNFWYSELISRSILPAVSLLGSDAPALQLRLARAFVARDKLQRCYFHPVGLESGLSEEALFYLDALLVALDGAFGLWARSANCALSPVDEKTGQTFSERQVSWSKRWLKGILNSEPRFVALLGPDAPVRVLVEACAALRNWIHGPPLEGVLLQEEYGERFYCVVVPVGDTLQDVRKMTRQFAGEWGEKPLETDLLLLELPQFVERLLACSLGSLDLLIRTLYHGQESAVPSTTPLEAMRMDQLKLPVSQMARRMLGLVPEEPPYQRGRSPVTGFR